MLKAGNCCGPRDLILVEPDGKWQFLAGKWYKRKIWEKQEVETGVYQSHVGLCNYLNCIQRKILKNTHTEKNAEPDRQLIWLIEIN